MITENLRPFSRCLAAALLLLLSAAAFAQDSARIPNAPLSPGDVIHVKVFQEDDLESTLRIENNGTATLPLIGSLRLGGLSPQAAAEAIRAALARDYLVNPQVSVNVTEYSKRRFTIIGQVQKPGDYEIPDRASVTLLQAIGMAGGYTRLADPAKVYLKRKEGGEERVTRLDAKRMASGAVANSVSILPGDVITVGESIF